MKQIELERRLTELGRKVQSSGLIPKLRDVARVGIEFPDKDHQKTIYRYEDLVMIVDYHTGTRCFNEVFKVFIPGGNAVFDAVMLETPGSAVFPNPVVISENIVYELRAYFPGPWERHVNEIYDKTVTDINAEQLADVRARFRIDAS